MWHKYRERQSGPCFLSSMVQNFCLENSKNGAGKPIIGSELTTLSQRITKYRCKEHPLN